MSNHVLARGRPNDRQSSTYIVSIQILHGSTREAREGGLHIELHGLEALSGKFGRDPLISLSVSWAVGRCHPSGFSISPSRGLQKRQK